MSDAEFLKRWSRRKQEAREEAEEAAKAAEQAPPVEAAVTPQDAASPEPEIDLSKLPSLDSINAATDITEFLRKGIPAELSRAALRRAWTADPAIRDFVGLAENAWDFTDPNAIPGFGALHGTPEQITAMVERVTGGVREAAEKLAELPEREQEQRKSDPEGVSATANVLADPSPETTSLPDVPTEPVVAAQPEASGEEHSDVAVRRRTHGGALPS